MYNKLILLLLLGSSLHSCAQQAVRKPANDLPYCEGCEVVMESPIPFDKLPSIDTLPGYDGAAQKLYIHGVVYHPDGKTPAAGIVLYVYQTDESGHYSNKLNEKGNAGRHGYIKGWVKTDVKGRYGFYTMRPAPYPGESAPSHIHPVIKEPGRQPYFVDEFLFDDDPLLTASHRRQQEGRGGSGILKLERTGFGWQAIRNITLLP